jgi:hypothetical protein
MLISTDSSRRVGDHDWDCASAETRDLTEKVWLVGSDVNEQQVADLKDG